MKTETAPQSILRRLSRPNAYLITLVAALTVPSLIPSVGIDYTYFFIFIIVFIAWLIFKWESFEALANRSTFAEILLGLGAVAGIYAYKIASSTRLGLLDTVIIFAALAVTFFGFRSFKLMWVPAAYGVVLLLGYQVENDIPNYVALQDWMAGVMASAMNALGVDSVASGHIVALNANSSSPLLLDVASDCTGVQGVLAFGVLASMALIGVKAKLSRLIPLFALGFIGIFLINILRLLIVFLTFEYFGVSLGNAVHVYAGYTLFIVFVVIFWTLAFKYMSPNTRMVVTPVMPQGSAGNKPAR